MKVFNIHQTRKIIVGFSRSPRILSRIIRWIEGSEISHVYIKFRSDLLDRSIIYEASGTTVNFVNLETHSKRSEIVAEFELRVSIQDYRNAIQFALDNTGKPYGFLNLIGLGLVKVVNRLGFRIKNPFADGGKTFICSELTAELLRSFSNLNTEIKSEYLTPSDIYRIFVDKTD